MSYNRYPGGSVIVLGNHHLVEQSRVKRTVMSDVVLSVVLGKPSRVITQLITVSSLHEVPKILYRRDFPIKVSVRFGIF